MRQKEQKMRYTDKELALIKNVFAGDDTNLYAVRKHMLGCELTDGESNALKGFNDDVKALIRKAFMPRVDGDAPIFQIVDMQLGLNNDIKGKSYEDAEDYILAKQIEMDYIDRRLQTLEGSMSDDSITLEKLGDIRSSSRSEIRNVYVNIIARNYLLSYIDSFINDLKNLAGLKEETVEQTKERMAKNSSK